MTEKPVWKIKIIETARSKKTELEDAAKADSKCRKKL